MVSTAHRVLFEKYHILHRDVSVNNTMMYDILESQVHGASETSHHSEALGGVAGDSGEGGTMEQNLRGWDAERREQIQAGHLRSGLLIDFDYGTVLDQTFPAVPGDRTVSASQISIS